MNEERSKYEKRLVKEVVEKKMATVLMVQMEEVGLSLFPP